MPAPKVKLVRVRCLGPKPAEHTFLSRDPIRERVCPSCREKLAAMPMARLERPMSVRIDG